MVMGLLTPSKIKQLKNGIVDVEYEIVADSPNLYFACEKCFKSFKDFKLRDRHQKNCDVKFEHIIYDDKKNTVKIALVTNDSSDKERQAAENIAYAIMYDQEYSDPLYRMDIPMFEPHLEHHMFLLLYKERLVGYACYIKVHIKNEKERKLNLRLLWISPKYRKKGLGRILYEGSSNHFPEEDRTKIYYGGPEIKNLDLFVRKFVKEKQANLLTGAKFDSEYAPRPDD
ncbi:TPA: GNAT family N-acetyltransferase [archaeon]|nr:GNAT family N-acetyltransferase [Candidatus Naiadarchaeales archaeon SRR2090159.bin1288]